MGYLERYTERVQQAYTEHLEQVYMKQAYIFAARLELLAAIAVRAALMGTMKRLKNSQGLGL